MDWFRYYTATLESRKIQDLPPVLFKAWVNLLCIARTHDGVLPPLAEISFKLRCSTKQAALWIFELQKRFLIDEDPVSKLLMPHDWREHQYVSDNVYERVKKHRAKQAEATKGNVSRNVPETPRARDRTEQIQNRTESEAETPQPALNGTAEFPAVLAEIRKHDAAADDVFARRLMMTVVQSALSNPKFPRDQLDNLTDENVARCVAESYRSGPKNHGTGLLLNRVPGIVLTWSLED